VRTTWAYRLILLALVISAPGCAMGRWMTNSPNYKQAQIRYHIQGNLVDQKPQPAPVQPAVAGEPPAMVVQPSSDPDKQYVRTLDLVYPYPADSDKALAILHIKGSVDSSSVQGAGGFARRNANEILMLTLKRHDVDVVLRDLAREGYFEGQNKSQPGVTLTTVIDGHHRTTPWVRSERLDTLAQRLIAKGKHVDPAKVPEILAAMNPPNQRNGRPPRGAGNPTDAPTSLPPVNGAPATMPSTVQPLPGMTYPLPEPSSYRHQDAGPALPLPMPPAATTPGMNMPGAAMPGQPMPAATMPSMTAAVNPPYPATSQGYPVDYPQTASVQPYPATYPQTTAVPQTAYPQTAPIAYPQTSTTPMYPQTVPGQAHPQTIPVPAYPQTTTAPQAAAVPGTPAYPVQ